MPRTIEIKVITDTKQTEAGAERVKRAFKSALDPTSASVASLRSSVSGLNSVLLALGGAAVFKQVAQFGIDLDKSRNTMTALTGSVTKANEKLAELRELTKTSPGVTNTFATQLFNQLKAIGGIGDQVINSVIKSLGKLNTVFADVGPEFSRNLVQIFQQGFERSDIKEALGRVPIFEQLLKSAFGTNDPDKLRKLKASGKLTLEGFLTGFSEAVNTDPRLKDIQESLGGKLQKGFDEIKVKLAELGEKILRDLIPVLDKLIPLLSTMLDFFNKLPDGIKAATIGLLAFAPALSGVTNAVIALRGAVVALGGFLTTPAGVAALAVVGLATAGFALEDLISNKIPANVRSSIPQVATDLSGKPIFAQAPPGEVVGFGSTLKKLDFRRGGLGAFNDATGRFGDPVKKAAKDLADLGKGTKKAKEVEDLLSAKNVQRRDEPSLAETLAKQQRAIDEQADTLSRVFLQQQKDEAQAFQGIVKEIQSNNAKAAKEALEAQEKFNKELQETIKLAQEADPAFRFMRGLRGETDAVASSFERLGQNIGDAFGDLKNLLSSLGAAVKQFFGDLLSATIRTTLASAVGPLLGQAGGGILGNLFRTPSFAGGGGITVPASVSGGGLGSIFSGIFGGGGSASSAAQSATGIFANGAFARGLSGGSGFSLGGLLGGLSSAAPLLGLGLGSGFGGQSVAGQILGAAGGAAVGLGVSFGSAVFGAGGGLAQAGLAALGPIGLIGVPLLIGASLLGKAKQRRQDEEASGQMLTQALAQIRELKAGIDSGSIGSSQARAIFENQILAQFIQGINSLKTESVRRSRLTNQVADLRRVFNELIEPSIAAQAAKQATSAANALAFSRQIPEFATGGTTRGGIAFLHEGEKILNLTQQSRVRAMAGPDVFERAGVPGPSRNRNFDIGGTMPSGGQSAQPIEITLEANVVISEKTATGIYITGGRTASGRAVTVNQFKVARTNREL